MFIAKKQTQVGTQPPGADGLAMDHVQVLLLVDILKLGIPKAHLRGLVIELVLAAGEVETVRSGVGASAHEQALHAGVVTRAVAAKLAGIEGQVLDFPRGDLRPAKGLWQ
ncbi:hypothetical protein D9M71_568760 [compost metagenome]